MSIKEWWNDDEERKAEETRRNLSGQQPVLNYLKY
jgi:hypothetical protein